MCMINVRLEFNVQDEHFSNQIRTELVENDS